MSSAWSPRPDGPAEDLARALRPALASLCAGLAAGQARDRSVTLPARQSGGQSAHQSGGPPMEARLRASFDGKVPFGVREALGYGVSGVLQAPGGAVPFKGSAVLDVATGAFLDLSLTLG